MNNIAEKTMSETVADSIKKFNHDTIFFSVKIVVLIVLCIGFGFIMGSISKSIEVRDIALQLGCGKYNSFTGQFEWVKSN